MRSTNPISKFSRIVRWLKDEKTEYDLSAYRDTLIAIDELDQRFGQNTDTELRDLFQSLQDQASATNEVGSSTVISFAIVRETIRRQLDLDPFDEQLLAGLAMLSGKIVDMKTGEGKTLAAIFPICAAALLGKGVQVLTFNDYLARRDAEWAGVVFTKLGLSSAFIQQNMSPDQRRQSYDCDICYLTAKEFGFDYLRDGLCQEKSQRVQRDFNFVLIDEADSILIDEARSPLIIASSSDDDSIDLTHIAKIIRMLEPEKHLSFDEYKRNISFSDEGIELLEKRLHCQNLYDRGNNELITQLQYAAHAQYLLHRDTDYIVADDQIKLVDEFTGRSAVKRRWPDGLHDAVEAKESIISKRKASMLGSISLQELCKLVPIVAGMTGTALASAQEFERFYKLITVVIPTHKPCVRQDLDDRIFVSIGEKHRAILEEVRRLHAEGRPVLVGTSSVAESSTLADKLRALNIPCRLLNALDDTEEAEIVSQAGGLGAVTISTNMAGRGTDIVLGAGNKSKRKRVEALGGLYVIGTNRHESERIDFQLRGRAGRQGDPGTTSFFISLDDPLYGKYQLHTLLDVKWLASSQTEKGSGEIESYSLTKLLSHLQRVIDGENLEIKKTLAKYSTLIEKQRLHIRLQRDTLLQDPESSLRFFESMCTPQLTRLSRVLDGDTLQSLCMGILLFCMDRNWRGHLADLADLQSCISLRTMGGRPPFLEFQKEANGWYFEQLRDIEERAIAWLDSLRIENGRVDLGQLEIGSPSSTWTYQINDVMFDDLRDALIIQPSLAVGIFLYVGPLMLLPYWFKRRMRRK